LEKVDTKLYKRLFCFLHIASTVTWSISAEMYNNAAESAMESMKGRLANKYYALAEEASAQCEEEEE